MFHSPIPNTVLVRAPQLDKLTGYRTHDQYFAVQKTPINGQHMAIPLVTMARQGDTFVLLKDGKPNPRIGTCEIV